MPATIFETASFLGRARSVELSCFELLGRRALAASDPAVGVFLAGSARAHAWRALQVEELLPVSLGLPGVEEATRSPGEALDDALGAVLSADNDGAVLDALGAVLYPGMLCAYRDRFASLTPTADAPAIRALRRVISDLEAVRDELDLLYPDPSSTARAAEALAAAIFDVGGAFGR